MEDAVNRLPERNSYAVVFFYNPATRDEKYCASNVARMFSLPAAAMPLYIAPQVDITASICNNLNSMYPSPSAANTPVGSPGQNHLADLL